MVNKIIIKFDPRRIETPYDRQWGLKGGPSRAAIRRGRQNGEIGGIRHLTIFEGGKIAVRPGCR